MSYFIHNGQLITADGKLITKIIGESIDDWFLPSYAGVFQMWNTLHSEGVGGFTSDGYYWASTEHPSIGVAASVVRFTASVPSIIYQTKNTTYNRVRAARSFTGDVGEYSLRDTGPAGGLIFAIDGTTYYEASPSDVSASAIWSDVTTQIGTTGNTLGTGLANSNAIVAQSSTVGIAAELCLSLSITP